MKTPILGSAYVARSVNAADNRLINLFPEAIPEGGKEAGFLNRAPGLKLQQTIGTGPIRALWSNQTHGSDFFVVSGNEFYKVLSLTGAPVLLGTVTGTGPVSIADNGIQLFLACNPDAFIYDEALGTFYKVTDTDFPGAVTVGFLDGYFVFSEPNSQKFWITQAYGTAIDGLDFASAEGAPDLLTGLIVDHREVWLFGTNSVEVWYNSGNTIFPIERIQGAFNEIGCASAASITKMDNGLFWLGTDARGQGIVYRANGYTGARISTHAIEYAIAQYDTITNAVAYTYQQEGHSFYVLTFPTANATWVYDVATQAWHERASFTNGAFGRHRGNCQCNFEGNTLIGDFENGNIYTFDLDVYTDNGAEQKWLRSWRALSPGQNDLNRTAHHSLQLDAESGVGLVVGQGNDPQVMLRWSDDGGHTWSNEHWKSMGALGQYGYRTIWRRLGMTLKLRDRVYEVSGTDPVKIAIMGAQLILTPTNG